MRPRRLEPRFLEKVWGSTRLAPWFPDSDQKIGEIWFETESIPLLVKFIFTSDKLSVQVHPGDAYAREHHASCGKTEMWHILAAEPGARIAAGFREAVSEAQLGAAARSGEIEDLLEWFDARPGDTFFIPAGTVHAIGGGLVLCEIQQRSDVTYRLYDYGRLRELHLEHGVAVSDRGPHAARSIPAEETLVSCEYFTTLRWNISGERTYFPERDSILIILAGSAQLNGEHASAGEVWYLPAPSQIEIRGNVTILLTHA